MYLTLGQIQRAITELKRVHPFFGITFLACKRGMIPVGTSSSFQINKKEDNLLSQYYKPDIHSSWYYHPFRTSGVRGGWVSARYASTGSQKTRTSGHLAKAFIHRRATAQWGWSDNYLQVLSKQLLVDRTYHVPAYWLAVWLYRSEKWHKEACIDDPVRHLISEFKINETEREMLFDMSIPTDEGEGRFQEHRCSDEEILGLLPPPPDAKPEHGGALRLLKLDGIGPAERLELEPGERLTLLTGDNGLGKTFLLECAWWSLTGIWAGRPALPRDDADKMEPTITYQIAGKGTRAAPRTTVHFDWETHSWPFAGERPTIPGLIVYARVDGSFAVWDPIRHTAQASPAQGGGTVLIFTREEALKGQEGKTEGLLRDWVTWQRNPNQETFGIFKQVIGRLSPPESPLLAPGKPVRISGEPREIPTIQHTYGIVPFVNESAGIKRIVTLAYLLVWAWSEHLIAASLAKRSPESNLVVLIDELEAHLHPKWQRVILPGILDVTGILDKRIDVQLVAATHSPLVLASVESYFKEETDCLYYLDLTETGDVRFVEIPFLRHGTVDDWLVSEVFELKEARSREAEHAVERAKILFQKDTPSREELLEVTGELRMAVPPEDVFWARWAYFLERKGIKL